MRLVISGQEFVNEYSFIDKIDMKGAASQLATLVFEVVWRADDGGNTARREVILQQDEFAGCRQVCPIENRNVWHGRAAPFAIRGKQRFQQSFNRGELPQMVASCKCCHCGELEQQAIQPLLIRQT